MAFPDGHPNNPIPIPVGGPWPEGEHGTFYRDMATGELFRYETGLGFQIRGVPPSGGDQTVNIVASGQPFIGQGQVGNGQGSDQGSDQGANMANGTAWGAGVGENWQGSPVFGEYTPEQQYTSLMASSMPNYYLPRYGQMAQRQFAPTFGRYLLGGYGAGTTTDDVTTYADPTTTGLGTGRTFADWYTGGAGGAEGVATPAGGVPPTSPADISAGYALARQFGGLTPQSETYQTLAGQNPGMAYAMQDPAAVQAMAMARYYGGGGPVGGYAGRAVENTLSNLYNRWATEGAQIGGQRTSPAGFLGYLGGLSGRFA